MSTLGNASCECNIMPDVWIWHEGCPVNAAKISDGLKIIDDFACHLEGYNTFPA